MVETRSSASHGPHPPCTPPAWHPSATQRAAGLLACGSTPHPLPSRPEPVAWSRLKLSAYSCGGSHRIGPEARTTFPFHLLAEALRRPDCSHDRSRGASRMVLVPVRKVPTCESVSEIDPFRRPAMSPALPRCVGQHQVLTSIWAGSGFRPDRAANGMPVHGICRRI